MSDNGSQSCSVVQRMSRSGRVEDRRGGVPEPLGCVRRSSFVPAWRIPCSAQPDRTGQMDFPHRPKNSSKPVFERRETSVTLTILTWSSAGNINGYPRGPSASPGFFWVKRGPRGGLGTRGAGPPFSRPSEPPSQFRASLLLHRVPKVVAGGQPWLGRLRG